jgi:hypothetical protein
VYFYGFTGNGQDDEVWDKVGQAIGNLQALETLRICSYYDEDVNEVGHTAALEILVPILSHVRQKIALKINSIQRLNAEESLLFARAIRGHPEIASSAAGDNIPYEFFNALATLPALESIDLRQGTSEDESALTHHDSLTELLRVPSLKSVYFWRFDFTTALRQAIANALMEGTAITKLEFTMCSFSAEEMLL